MNIAKISELVDNHYELLATLKEIEDLIDAPNLVHTKLAGELPNGKRIEIAILPQLARLILHHQAEILRLQLEQIPDSIRQQTANTTPRLVAGSISPE